MKHFLKLFFVTLIVLTSCKDDSGESGDPHINMITAHTWGNPVVTNDPDGDLSEDYEDFVISFSKTSSGEFTGTYVVANGGIAFPQSSGKWKFSSDFSQLIFDSGKTYDVVVEENQLTLDFTIAPEGGRVSGLSGHFTFELQPF